jgi:hypothetical protein
MTRNPKEIGLRVIGYDHVIVVPLTDS